MQKTKLLFTILMLILFTFIAANVIAENTDYNSEADMPKEAQLNTEYLQNNDVPFTTSDNKRKANCELEYYNREKRIKCRLESKKNDVELTIREDLRFYEACRKLTINTPFSRQKCQELHIKTLSCMQNDNSIEKHQCYIIETGLDRENLEMANDINIRRYIAALLINLSGRIESLALSGAISIENGSMAITSISNINEKIFHGVPSIELKTMIHELRIELNNLGIK